MDFVTPIPESISQFWREVHIISLKKHPQQHQTRRMMVWSQATCERAQDKLTRPIKKEAFYLPVQKV